MHRRRDAGAVLLGMVLLLVLATAALMPWRSEPHWRKHDIAALGEAQAALLGFALGYPNRPGVNNRAAGPGLLPCPDTRFDSNDVPGQADPPCAQSSGTETGLLPWRTLGLQAFGDEVGAPLWYAVANVYRNNPAGRVGSDTAPQLMTLPCTAESHALAALVLAPGAALSSQDRNPAQKSVRYDPRNYLEGQSASRGDGCFGALVQDIANDVLLGISHERFNEAIESRVLGEVARALQRYHDDPEGAGGRVQAWPWLSPWPKAAAAGLHGIAGTRLGALPLRQVGVSFPAPFTAQWELDIARAVTSGALPPDPACLRRNESCTVHLPGTDTALVLPALVPDMAAQCTWLGGTAMRCTAEISTLEPHTGSRLTRRWTIEFRGLPRILQAPDATHPRRESVLFQGSLPTSARIAVRAEDFQDGAPLGATAVEFVAGDTLARFAIAGIPFDLEVDDDGVIDPPTRRSPGELPGWFVANGWHQAVLVAFAGSALASGTTGTCETVGDCLQVLRDGQPSRQGRGLIVLAGATLAGQQRPGKDLSDWFERENATGSDTFRFAPRSTVFNDRLRVLDAAP